MTDDYKTIVERLQPDGANWVSYRDRIIWALGGKGWHEHLTSDSPTALYTAVGDVGNVTPAMRWQADDKAAMHLIASSIPNSVFSNIKSSTTAKAAWDALKLLYEGRTSLIESILSSSKKCESSSRPWARQCPTPSILQS